MKKKDSVNAKGKNYKNKDAKRNNNINDNNKGNKTDTIILELSSMLSMVEQLSKNMNRKVASQMIDITEKIHYKIDELRNMIKNED